MSLPQSPFAKSSSSPGFGEIGLRLLPPQQQVLTQCTFQYPLKLVAPAPHVVGGHPVTIVFLLTYGGGLLGGDKINLKVSLDDNTRLVLLTQGSTKLFKSSSREIVSGQSLSVEIGSGAALCYIPDPTQPFGESVYKQKQNFKVSSGSSLCVLDWVSEGRKARGESWHLWKWQGRNEVRDRETGRLLLRDAILLNDDSFGGTNLAEKSNNYGALGTLILRGPCFASLSDHIMDDFTSQPKIGNKSWKKDNEKSEAEKAGELKQASEKQDGLLWTAVRTRGFVLIKFGSRDIDGARRWLRNLLIQEGSIERHFGHQALLCLR